jgi:glycosyltransferase involved in cell wall biosynthesis
VKISFVIPAYNEEAYLPACLSALLAEIAKHASVLETEILVVDNASTDRTALVAGSFPGVRVVTEPVKGVSRARQAGLSAAEGDIIAYIDADTKVTENWILIMLAEFAANPKLVALSGLCVFYDLPPFWRRIAGPYQGFIGWITDLMTGELVFGGNLAARREAMLAVGGFDTSIAFYGEDQNIVQRLKKVGKYKFSWKLVAETSARRFNAEGVLNVVGTYAANFLSLAVLKRPTITSYRDIR